ncbi:MAG: 50S ribosomal protein L37ae [Candidatus Thermoplasmatota archaeon]
MARRTRKAKSAGRFGTRYGVRSRSTVRAIEKIQKAKHVCKKCGHKKVVRISTGIWKCKKCGTKFAGAAYMPKTEAGEKIRKILKGDIEPPEAGESIVE